MIFDAPHLAKVQTLVERLAIRCVLGRIHARRDHEIFLTSFLRQEDHLAREARWIGVDFLDQLASRRDPVPARERCPDELGHVGTLQGTPRLMIPVLDPVGIIHVDVADKLLRDMRRPRRAVAGDLRICISHGNILSLVAQSVGSITALMTSPFFTAASALSASRIAKTVRDEGSEREAILQPGRQVHRAVIVFGLGEARAADRQVLRRQVPWADRLRADRTPEAKDDVPAVIAGQVDTSGKAGR